MRIDVVTIFPDYLAPLALSLPGKAVASGLVDLRVHDLRDHTHDRHRTVDDTPYGGGAGMVMKPEPWGEALDALLADGPTPRLLVMTPAGRPFSQADAERLSHEKRLVFACGRYEGIDARVIDWAREHMPVEEVSIGDYVLNGGEVAAMVCIEAITRLVPGFMGNPESIVEESHSGDEALLEYPAYTKPTSWRGHEVPAILLSGDHGRIQRWRHEQSRIRTRRRRPDLYTARPDRAEPGSMALPGGDPGVPQGDRFTFERVHPGHARELLAAWQEAADRVLAGGGYQQTGWPIPLETGEEASRELMRDMNRHEAGVEYVWVARGRDGEVAGVVSMTAGEVATDWSEPTPLLRWWVRREADAHPLRRELAAWAGGLPVAVKVARR